MRQEVFAARAVAVFVVVEAGDFAEKQTQVAVKSPCAMRLGGDEARDIIGPGYDPRDEAAAAQNLRAVTSLFGLMEPGQDGAPLHQRILQKNHGAVGEPGFTEKALAEAGVFAAVCGL